MLLRLLENYRHARGCSVLSNFLKELSNPRHDGKSPTVSKARSLFKTYLTLQTHRRPDDVVCKMLLPCRIIVSVYSYPSTIVTAYILIVRLFSAVRQLCKHVLEYRD